MNRYFRVVLYLKVDDIYGVNPSNFQFELNERLKPPKEGFVGNIEECVIREFKLTNEHKFNRAKDNEVK